jgi:membrane protease YdiL (CAAX protease family)
MGPFLEPLILYCILFLPGALRHDPPAELAIFSLGRELTRTIAFNLPALALIWYLQQRFNQTKKALLPGRKDLFAFLCAFPALMLTSLSVSLASSFFPGLPGGIKIEGPRDIIGLLVVFLSCISTGYLEEGYFRYYLGKKFDEQALEPWVFILTSTALFALCHRYEGPWGTMNSILAGLILAFIYTRFRSLHGLALAHGFYNLTVYVLGTRGS